MPHNSNREDLRETAKSVLLIPTDRAEDPVKADLTDVTEDPVKADPTDVTEDPARADPVSIVLLSETEMYPVVRDKVRDLSVTETSSRAVRLLSVTDVAVWAALQDLAIRIRMMTDVSLLLPSVLQSPVPTAS